MSRRRRVGALALDDLDDWLAAQPDIARRNWSVSAIDGFCAALAAGPERISAEAWLRVIFGPGLPTTPKGLGAVQAVLDHHHAIDHRLRLDDGSRWRPIYMRTDDGTVLAQPWAAGFMFAVKRWPEAWRPMFERGHSQKLLLPIITCEVPDQVDALLAGKPRAIRELIAQAYHHIPDAVRAIREYWIQDKYPAKATE
jgi:yecA family protein